MTSVAESAVVDRGTLSFTIESRLLRELGERLVRQPEIAVVELIKNAYDADATECRISFHEEVSIIIKDDGVGMTLDRFRDGWMRIGTSVKEATPLSPRYGRRITGEKGIGRFAVRFLGRALHLESVADDPARECRTRLTAEFDWQEFDKLEDLGQIHVPYVLTQVDARTATGTTLQIGKLRDQVDELDLQRVRTESIGVLSPLRSLIRAIEPDRQVFRPEAEDPGFALAIQEPYDEAGLDVGAEILESYVLRATVEVTGPKIDLKVYRPDRRRPYLSVVDRYENDLGPVHVDIRFFPRRKGVFAEIPVDGRRAYTWIRENSGVAVFDRDFRVQPYGAPHDDWLQNAADAARNRREPRSSIAHKHFPMSSEIKADTAQNWMLRLPQSAQLVGVVQVEGRREGGGEEGEGLIAAADREGFVANETFAQLRDVVRGAIEAIAQCDRRLQLEEEAREQEELLESIRAETNAAIQEVEASAGMTVADKTRVISAILQTQQLVEEHEETSREREHQLETMSLLGVVAGFMTHEFGSALGDLKAAQKDLRSLARTNDTFRPIAESLERRIENLTEFAKYSSGYIEGSRAVPRKRYSVRPRIQQVIRVFGQYAEARRISVDLDVEKGLPAPLVPVSLYNGIALNLYTNALKAVTARSGRGPRRIGFRAWNEGRGHYLEVSDTGVGIPKALRQRVFDPLFTTTSSRRDPLGSGMGLGLSVVQRGATAFGGNVDVVDPPPDFVTSVRVRLPLGGGDRE